MTVIDANKAVIFQIKIQNSFPGIILRDCIKTKKNIPKYLVDNKFTNTFIKKWKENFFFSLN